jgi:hypothetical protein
VSDSIESLACLDVGHEPAVVLASRSDERMTLLTCCQRCGCFDEVFGFDTEQSDQIWSLLVKES